MRARTLLVLLFCLPSVGHAQGLGFDIWVSSGWSAGWSFTMSPDRSSELKEGFADGHQASKRFQLVGKRLADVKALLEREDFFSLPTPLGSFPPDAPFARIEVRAGSKQHTIELGLMPQDLAVIWKTDPSTIGRAYRVCEGLRAISGALSQPCPGVPSEAPRVQERSPK